MAHRGLKSRRISKKQDERNIYVIMKIMCSPSYHHNGFMAAHALEHVMYVLCPRALHCFYNTVSICI